jgi:hypothetical protein
MINGMKNLIKFANIKKFDLEKIEKVFIFVNSSAVVYDELIEIKIQTQKKINIFS